MAAGARWLRAGSLALAALQRAAMEEISETQKGLAAGLYSMSGFGGSAIGGAMGGVSDDHAFGSSSCLDTLPFVTANLEEIEECASA